MLVWTDYGLPPIVLQDGFRFARPDGRVRTQMGRGGTKSRGSAVGQTTIVPCTFLVDVRGLATVDRFVEDASDGNAPFLIPDQRFDGMPMLDESGDALLDSDGDEIVFSGWWVVTFETLPVDLPAGTEWRVSFELEKH